MSNLKTRKDLKRKPVTDSERTVLELAINSYKEAAEAIEFAHVCELRGRYERPHVHSIDEMHERIEELKSIIKNGWVSSDTSTTIRKR